jgi:hypothetical protein
VLSYAELSGTFILIIELMIFVFLLYIVVFGRAWQYEKYSYGVWQ